MSDITRTSGDISGAAPATGEFVDRADPYRRELMAHCYRMMGSVHDAEDLVQETYIRAWRAYDRFEGRSSLRTWLYSIATRVCLTALESSNKRPLPTGLGGPAPDPAGDLNERTEISWLEPVPDDLVAVQPQVTDPADIVQAREDVRLALIAALQHLPPRQRAVLVLRDVLKWKAAEVADLLDLSTPAVNSLLQRARTQVETLAPSSDDAAQELTGEQKELLDQFATAFETYDIDALITLFTEQAVWEMPPFPEWFQTPAQIGKLIANQCPAQAAGDIRMVPTAANGQPAFGMYMRGADDVFRPFSIVVLTITDNAVEHVVSFFDVSLYPAFGMPELLEDASSAATN